MRKAVFILCSFMLIFSTAVQAKKPRLIEPIIDFSQGNYGPALSSPQGNVVIRNVTIDREIPSEAGADAVLNPEYEASQIGYYKTTASGRDYLITLKDKTTEQFVREAVELALSKSGFNVVSGGADAKVIDVTVNKLWMWTKRIPDNDRYRFHFTMETEVQSDSPELNGIGVVSVTDYRNGSRDKNWKSYRNTIMHSMKAYIQNFNNAFQSAQRAAN